jgi:hypothetical protein
VQAQKILFLGLSNQCDEHFYTLFCPFFSCQPAANEPETPLPSSNPNITTGGMTAKKTREPNEQNRFASKVKCLHDGFDDFRNTNVIGRAGIYFQGIYFQE